MSHSEQPARDLARTANPQDKSLGVAFTADERQIVHLGCSGEHIAEQRAASERSLFSRADQECNVFCVSVF